MLKVVGCWGEPSTPLEAFPDSRGIIGKAFQTRHPQLVTDVTTCDEYHCYDLAVRSELAVPVADLSRERVEAIINVESNQLSYFSYDDIGLVSRLGSLMLQRCEQLSALTISTERAERLLRILDTIPDEVLLIDNDFRPVWANGEKRSKFDKLDLFLSSRGYKDPAAIFDKRVCSERKEEGKEKWDKCYWLIEGHDDICPFCVCHRAMQSGAPVTSVLYRPKKLDFTVELSAAPVFSPDGSLHGCVEVARTVTQREKVTSLLRTLLTGLSHNQLMESALECLHTHLGYDRVRLYSIDEQEMVLRGIDYIGDHPSLTKEIFSKKTIPIPPDLRKIWLKGDKASLVVYGQHSKVEESLAFWRIHMRWDSVKSQIDPDGTLQLDKVKEVACTPLVSGSMRSILFVDNRVTGRIFSYEDLQALTLFSRLASPALDTIRHNELRFLMAMIGETSAGITHEIDNIVMAGRFESELYPRLAATLAMARDYFRRRPTQEESKLLGDCLGALGSRFSSAQGVPIRGTIIGFADALKSELETRSVELESDAVAYLPRVLYCLDKTPETCAKIIKKLGKTPLLELIAKTVKVILTIESHKSVAERLRVYIEALHAVFSTKEAKQLVPEHVADVRELVRPVVEIAKKKAKGIEIDDSDCTGLPRLPVKVITGHVFLAWLALLDNAIRAARSARVSSLVKIAVSEGDGECQVSILNNGERIPDDKIRYLGKEPFTTEGGTGLGLMFAYDWIEKYNNGALLHKYDKDLRMTVFTTKLPLVPQSGPMSPNRAERQDGR
jgi:signal transduction histidine kinase